jgi:hypothetical protein
VTIFGTFASIAGSVEYSAHGLTFTALRYSGPRPRKTKKADVKEHIKRSSTSAYSLTSPSAKPGCSLSRHPTNPLTEPQSKMRCNAIMTTILRRRSVNAIGRSRPSKVGVTTLTYSFQMKTSCMACERRAKIASAIPLLGVRRSPRPRLAVSRGRFRVFLDSDGSVIEVTCCLPNGLAGHWIGDRQPCVQAGRLETRRTSPCVL